MCIRDRQDTVRKSGFEKYTRGHCGHSVGCNIFVEERPFVAPGEEQEFTVFMPGMVMSIEVPFYSAAYGAFNIEAVSYTHLLIKGPVILIFYKVCLLNIIDSGSKIRSNLTGDRNGVIRYIASN